MVISGTRVQVEVSTQNAIAQQFGVPANSVTTTATVSRRLQVNGANSNIAGSWTVVYQLYASASKAAAVQAKVDELKTDPDTWTQTFLAILNTELQDAGVSADVANAMTLKAVSALDAIHRPGTSTTATSISPAGSEIPAKERSNTTLIVAGLLAGLVVLATGIVLTICFAKMGFSQRKALERQPQPADEVLDNDAINIEIHDEPGNPVGVLDSQQEAEQMGLAPQSDGIGDVRPTSDWYQEVSVPPPATSNAMGTPNIVDIDEFETHPNTEEPEDPLPLAGGRNWAAEGVVSI